MTPGRPGRWRPSGRPARWPTRPAAGEAELRGRHGRRPHPRLRRVGGALPLRADLRVGRLDAAARARPARARPEPGRGGARRGAPGLAGPGRTGTRAAAGARSARWSASSGPRCTPSRPARRAGRWSGCASPAAPPPGRDSPPWWATELGIPAEPLRLAGPAADAIPPEDAPRFALPLALALRGQLGPRFQRLNLRRGDLASTRAIQDVRDRLQRLAVYAVAGAAARRGLLGGEGGGAQPAGEAPRQVDVRGDPEGGGQVLRRLRHGGVGPARPGHRGRVHPPDLGGRRAGRAGGPLARRAAPLRPRSRSPGRSCTSRGPPTPPRTWTRSWPPCAGRAASATPAPAARASGAPSRSSSSRWTPTSPARARRRPGEGLAMETLRKLRASLEAFLARLSPRERVMVSAAAAAVVALRPLPGAPPASPAPSPPASSASRRRPRCSPRSASSPTATARPRPSGSRWRPGSRDRRSSS